MTRLEILWDTFLLAWFIITNIIPAPYTRYIHIHIIANITPSCSNYCHFYIFTFSPSSSCFLEELKGSIIFIFDKLLNPNPWLYSGTFGIIRLRDLLPVNNVSEVKLSEMLSLLRWSRLPIRQYVATILLVILNKANDIKQGQWIGSIQSERRLLFFLPQKISPKYWCKATSG